MALWARAGAGAGIGIQIGGRGGGGFRPGTSRRPVCALLHLRSARPTRVGSCSPVNPGVQGHPSRGSRSVVAGRARARDRDRLEDAYSAPGKRGASAGESEVKFAISESSRSGPSAQFPVLLDAAARVVTERASPGRDQEGGSQPRVWMERRGVCRKERICPGTAHLPLRSAQGPIVRQLAPGGHRFEERVPGAGWVQRIDQSRLFLASLNTWP